jgi:chromosome segregation ATPase
MTTVSCFACVRAVQAEAGNLLSVVQSLSASYEEVSERNVLLIGQMEAVSARVTTLTHDAQRNQHMLECLTREKDALAAQSSSAQDVISSLQRELRESRALLEGLRREVHCCLGQH